MSLRSFHVSAFKSKYFNSVQKPKCNMRLGTFLGKAFEHVSPSLDDSVAKVILTNHVISKIIPIIQNIIPVTLKTKLAIFF